MAAWLDAHGVALLAAWYVFSAVVSGMPEPDGKSGTGYRWLFHSLHLLAGDLSQLFNTSLQHRSTGNGLDR